jgi:hypothetical protein
VPDKICAGVERGCNLRTTGPQKIIAVVSWASGPTPGPKSGKSYTRTRNLCNIHRSVLDGTAIKMIEKWPRLVVERILRANNSVAGVLNASAELTDEEQKEK